MINWGWSSWLNIYTKVKDDQKQVGSTISSNRVEMKTSTEKSQNRFRTGSGQYSCGKPRHAWRREVETDARAQCYTRSSLQKVACWLTYNPSDQLTASFRAQHLKLPKSEHTRINLFSDLTCTVVTALVWVAKFERYQSLRCLMVLGL